MGRPERRVVEESEDWGRIVDMVPSLKLPRNTSIKIIPPFHGAVARFWLHEATGGERLISVYLDAHNALGYYVDSHGEPVVYWEIYPYEGAVMRVPVSDPAQMEACLKKAVADARRLRRKQGEAQS